MKSVASSDASEPLASHWREVTALFCDLRGFTACTKASEPEKVMGVRCEYHENLGALILQHEGTPDRLPGDMIVFNDAVPCDVERVVRLALDTRETVSKLVRQWARKGLRPAVSASCAAALTIATAVTYFGPPSRASAAEGGDVGASSDIAVTVVPAKNVCFVDTLQVTGVLVPRNEILVRPEREGLQIYQVLVEPGDAIVSGQILARLTAGEGQEGGGVAVRAPADGMLISASAIVGAMASARGEPLFRIAGKGEMELLAETPVRALARLKVDQPAKVEVVGVGELTGKVRLSSTAINPTTQLGQVRLLVGSDSRLRVGAFGRATIDIGRRCGPAIPLSAVLYGSSGTVVQVARDGQIETRRVIVGLLSQGQAEIREGLAEGEMVVARAGAFVRDGDRVRAVTAGESPARP